MHIRRVLAAALALLVAVALAFAADAKPPAKPDKQEKDPWVGEYRQFGGWNPDKLVKITKEDGYYLLISDDSRFRGYHWIEEKPGVLRDEKHVYGKIFRGEIKFADADRKPTPVLRAEFCYEWCYFIAP
jgi:hypothetical protein